MDDDDDDDNDEEMMRLMMMMITAMSSGESWLTKRCSLTESLLATVRLLCCDFTLSVLTRVLVESIISSL